MNINVKEKRHHYDASKLSLMVVGAARFELATSRSRTERATGLRYAPSETNNAILCYRLSGVKLKRFESRAFFCAALLSTR